MREIINIQIMVEKPEGKRPHGNLGVDGKMILEWISEK
jgi:UTP-glucose-1-phosphate uridylyltransferase